MKNEKLKLLVVGLIIGLAAVGLVLAGNPANMGFCIACFLRDTAGALGLHKAEVVQYIRPEIIGLVLGSFCSALAFREFRLPAPGIPVAEAAGRRFASSSVGAAAFLFRPNYNTVRKYHKGKGD